MCRYDGTFTAAFFPISHHCAGVNLQYGLLEGVSCDSRMTAQTLTLAASIVGKEILYIMALMGPAGLLNHLWLFYRMKIF